MTQPPHELEAQIRRRDAALSAARTGVVAARAELDEAVLIYLAAGGQKQQVAQILGVSKQAISKRYPAPPRH